MRRRTVSACRTYRYVLWRESDAGHPEYALFVGLNPSTADEVTDDPTVRRCKDFARRWGYGAVCVANLFAYRATDPAGLTAAAEPVGQASDRWLVRLAAGAGVVVAAWGVHGPFAGRDRAVAALPGGGLSCLALTKHGHLRHPLYVKRTAVPTAWVPPWPAACVLSARACRRPAPRSSPGPRDASPPRSSPAWPGPTRRATAS